MSMISPLGNRISTMLREEIQETMITIPVNVFTDEMYQWLKDNVGPEQHIGEWHISRFPWASNTTVSFKQLDDATAFKIRFL